MLCIFHLAMYQVASCFICCSNDPRWKGNTYLIHAWTIYCIGIYMIFALAFRIIEWLVYSMRTYCLTSIVCKTDWIDGFLIKSFSVMNWMILKSVIFQVFRESEKMNLRMACGTGGALCPFGWMQHREYCYFQLIFVQFRVSSHHHCTTASWTMNENNIRTKHIKFHNGLWSSSSALDKKHMNPSHFISWRAHIARCRRQSIYTKSHLTALLLLLLEMTTFPSNDLSSVSNYV